MLGMLSMERVYRIAQCLARPSKGLLVHFGESPRSASDIARLE
jgi:hypothetical protein